MKKRKYKEKGIKWVISRPGSTRRWTRGISMWDWMACPGLVFYSLQLMWSHRGVHSDTKHRPPVPSGMHYYLLPGLQWQGSPRACGSPPAPWDVSQVLGHLTQLGTLRQRNPTQSVTHIFFPPEGKMDQKGWNFLTFLFWSTSKHTVLMSVQPLQSPSFLYSELLHLQSMGKLYKY